MKIRLFVLIVVILTTASCDKWPYFGLGGGGGGGGPYTRPIRVYVTDQFQTPLSADISLYQVSSEHWKPGDSFILSESYDEEADFEKYEAGYYSFYVQYKDWEGIWTYPEYYDGVSLVIHAELIRPSYIIELEVIDADNNAVSGAEISYSNLEGEHDTKTDANGIALLKYYCSYKNDRVQSSVVSIKRKGHNDSTEYITGNNESTRYTIYLYKQYYTIWLDIYTADYDPIVSGLLQIVDDEGFIVHEEAVINCYSFSRTISLLKGSYTVNIICDTYIDQIDVPLIADAKKDFVMKLEPEIKDVSFKVLGEREAPLTNAYILINNEDGKFITQGYTCELGEYTASLKPGRYTYSVDKLGAQDIDDIPLLVSSGTQEFQCVKVEMKRYMYTVSVTFRIKGFAYTPVPDDISIVFVNLDTEEIFVFYPLLDGSFKLPHGRYDYLAVSSDYFSEGGSLDMTAFQYQNPTIPLSVILSPLL